MASIIFEHIFTGKGDILLLFPPGSGKTTKAIQALVAKATLGERTLYSGFTRALCSMATTWANTGGVVMAEKFPRSPKNCCKAKEVETLAGRGWSAVEHACRNCDQFDATTPTDSGCGWWSQWEDPNHLAWAVTHAHLPSGLPFRYLKPKTLVLDEGTVQACLGWAGGLENGFGSSDLESLAFSLPITDPGIHTIIVGEPLPGCAARLLMNLASRMARWNQKSSKMLNMINRIGKDRHSKEVIGAEAVGFLLGLDASSNFDTTTLKLLDALLLERGENKRVASSFPPRKRYVIKELPEPSFEALAIAPTPPNILVPLLDVLAIARNAIEARKAGTSNVSGAVPAKLGVVSTGRDEKVFTLSIRTFKPLNIPNGCRIVGLDATGNENLFERCVGRKVLLHRAHIPFIGSVIQATDLRLPRATLLHDKASTTRWVNDIKPYVSRLHEMHGKLLIITFKPLALRLQKEFKGTKGLAFRWFWGVRGEDFSSYPVQVTIGFPMAPPASTYLDAAAIHQGEDLDTTWAPEWRPYCVAGEEGKTESLGLEVEVPKDPRLRAVFELASDHELYQAACSRNRILRNDHLSVVLTHIPLLPEFRVPVTLRKVQELLATGKKEATTSDRVHELAESLLRKLGWVSKSLLEVVLVESSGNTKEINGAGLDRYFPPGWPMIYTIGAPGGYSPLPFLTRLSDGRSALRSSVGLSAPFSPNRLREAWSSYKPTSSGTGFEISARLVGQVGQPRKDHVFGDPNLWLWDHAELIRDSRYAIALDGDAMDAAALDRLRNMSEPGQRLVVTSDVVTADGFLDDAMDMDAGDRDAERNRMLTLLRGGGDDEASDSAATASRLVRLRG